MRPFRDGDAPRLAELMRSAVCTLGPRAYNAEQVRVWSLFPEDFAEFTQQLQQGVTLIAECEETAAAFGQLWPDDHIALLYTSPHFAGRGCASSIIIALEQAAMRRGSDRLDVEASHLARPVFERQGFQVLEMELVERHAVVFERFKMEKRLA